MSTAGTLAACPSCEQPALDLDAPGDGRLFPVDPCPTCRQAGR